MKPKLILFAYIITMLLSTGCSAPNTHGAPNNNSTESAIISEEKAREIALSHAAVDADRATFTKSHIDLDDGKRVYDVEFYTSEGKEYDYEIDPVSGDILDFDFDVENFAD